MCRFLKKHLFWSVVGFIFALYFVFLGIIFFAPRVDAQGRGFIPCTEEMMNRLYQCEKNKVWCAVKIVIRNNACDMRVIKKGFSLWLEGKQKTPWANYYFTPIIEPATDTDENFLILDEKEAEETLRQMEELNQKANVLKKEQEKLKNEEMPK